MKKADFQKLPHFLFRYFDPKMTTPFLLQDGMGSHHRGTMQLLAVWYSQEEQ
jgi:hypothetical protein